MDIRKLTILVAFCLNCFYSFAQKTNTEEEDFNCWALRLGAGYQQSGFIEIGVSRWNISDKGFGAAFLAYSIVELNSNFDGNKNISGLKFGVEAYSSIFAWGLELKYLSNFSESKFFFTPKIGIGLLGNAGLFIGYNFGDQANNFPQIGEYQISVNANINRKASKRLRGKG